MDKRIAKLSRDPFYIALMDRPISMFIDPPTGDVLIDEGIGPGRMFGAVLHADKGTRFLCAPTTYGCMVKVECRTFTWDAGFTEDPIEAANWVDAVNRFLETKRSAAGVNGTPMPITVGVPGV